MVRAIGWGVAAVVSAVILTVAGCAAAGGASSMTSSPPPPPSAAGTRPPPTTTTITDPVPTTTAPPPAPPTPLAAKPRITQDRISYGAKRRAEMAGYAYRHYGVRSFRLHPKLIVLHFTDSGPGSYPGVHALFNANTPNGGELPGVCAHYVVDQDGTVYQQVPLGIMCRHAIGVNDHAIGQGTTGTTCLVVDDDGLVRGRGSRPIEQRYPRPGWVEHDPEQLWSSVNEAAADALAAAGLSAADVRAIGITNQRETTILW